MSLARLLLSALLCIGLFAPADRAAADLKIAGTDLLGVGFSKLLYEWAGHHEIALALALDGSRAGIEQLKSGRAHLVIFLLPPNEDAGLIAFECVPFAYDRVVVLVPPASPLADVSLEQLGGIFGVGGPVCFVRWGELGVAGDWSGNAIVPHAPTAGDGIAAALFRHTVLLGRDFKSNVGRYESSADLALRLTGDSRAIALAQMPPEKPNLAKIVPVALHTGEPAYLPTPENLHSGDYPLRLPLRIAFRRESAKELQPLLHFLLSDELAPLLERTGLVALPAATRRQQTAALEKL